MRFLPAIALLLLAAFVCSEPAPPERVGPVSGGGFLLNNGWTIRPAGRQVPLDTLPMSMALSPEGRYLLVLNAGYKPPSISVLDVSSAAEIGRVPVADGWLGLTFTPKGEFVYVGGGSEAAVLEFSFRAGKLEPGRTFPVVSEDKRTPKDFIGDVALSPDGRLIYAADLYRDSIVVINPQSGRVIERFRTGRRPYRILFHPDGKSLFVTSWADGVLLHHDAVTGGILARVPLAPHPTDMLWRAGGVERTEAEDAGPPFAARLFIAAANTNTVRVIGVSEGKDLRAIETVNVAMTPFQPAGMTPSALAISADGNRLFVACSDANAVAVADVSESHSRVMGFVPTGWYPTAVKSLAGGRLIVLNGKGLGSHPNPKGPNPTMAATPAHLGGSSAHYVGRIQTGTASFIDPFDEAALDAYTKTVLRNSPYRDSLLEDAGSGEGNPVPVNVAGRSPIEHVVYIVKENRTYDQVLGDMRQANGDPSLVLFGEEITPNQHKLAREFVLFDNFYVNSDVSADGHSWSTAAIAPDYVQKLWPNSYAKRRRLYDYEGKEPAASPPAGYLWTNAAAAGVTLRNYGYFVTNRLSAAPDGTEVEAVRDSVLHPLTNLKYRAFDLKYPDVERARVFLADLAEFEKAGTMPQLLLARLGNDHTSGTLPGRVVPRSAVADNDYALGLIVEGLSRSRFWPRMAIFVLEDDAQNGPDHVDSHRSPAFVISPYIRRGIVDSTMYNTTSMLRTMELILGLRPMTHFDAAARPMAAAFQVTPDLKPYQAEAPRIPLDERNPAGAPGAARSARLDFDEEDRADEDELNAILWLALRGTEPPAPVRSYFSR